MGRLRYNDWVILSFYERKELNYGILVIPLGKHRFSVSR